MKLLKDALSGLRKYLATENLFKITKNAFLFHLKNFSFARYLNFHLDFLVKYKNGLITKTRLISKFMTSQSG